MPSTLELLARRTLRAGDGNLWHIREMRAHDVPGSLAPTCLIFDSGGVIRRFWTYPDLWVGLPDEELIEFVEQQRSVTHSVV